MVDSTPQPISVGQIVGSTMLGQDFLRWVNDPDTFYIWLQHTLRGEMLMRDENSKEYWALPKDVKGEFLPEQMTEEGAINIITKIRPYLNQFTFHADYTDDQITNMIIPITTEINIYLKRNQRRFHINDTNLSTIAIGIKTLIYTAFNMSGMRGFYTDVMKIGIGTPQEKEKGKILGIFPKP